jgi:O-antigen ligase
VAQVEMAFRYGTFASVFILEQATLTGVRLRARGTGFMTDPNDLGQSLVMAIPFLTLAWRKHSHIRNLLLVILPTIFLCYGIYLTGSRGTLLSLGVLIAFSLHRRFGPVGRKVFSICATVGGGAFLISGGGFLGMRDASAIRRIEAWSLGLQLVKQHPLVGVGYKQFWNYNEIVAHNSFVTCFSELGIPAFLIWMGMLVATISELHAMQSLTNYGPIGAEVARYSRAVQLSFYGFLAAAWFLSRTYVVTLYILVALVIALAGIARREKLPVPVTDMGTLIKRTLIASLSVIAMLYLSIRFTIR